MPAAGAVQTQTFLARATTAGAIAAELGSAMPAELVGDSAVPVIGIATFGAGAGHSLSYQAREPEGPAGGAAERTVICGRSYHRSIGAAARIIVEDPRAAFMIVLERLLATAGLDFERTLAAQAAGVEPGEYEAHPSAVIESPVIIGRGVVLGPHVVVRKGVVIGAGTIVAPGTVIGERGPAVHKGQDGRARSWATLHVGTTHIGPECEIGTHGVILRGILGQTRIGRGTILGNVVHIGHGADIGERVWMAAGVVVCGHAVIGDRAALGAGTIVRDNVRVGTDASVGMGSVVVKQVGDGQSVLGNPARAVERRLKPAPER
jgi:UDP-3-O-[3-hydroxymyristoyl] glucosamine N-acyltransferase